jgi:hypothetical protein
VGDAPAVSICGSTAVSIRGTPALSIRGTPALSIRGPPALSGARVGFPTVLDADSAACATLERRRATGGRLTPRGSMPGLQFRRRQPRHS